MHDIFAWPHGKRVAIVVSVMVESWSPGRWPSYFPRTSPLREGTVDLGAIQWSEYGGKEGIWRILDVLRRNKLSATVHVNGRSAELYPDAVEQIVHDGHELSGHGYFQDELLLYMTSDQEQATIRKTLDALHTASGSRPTAWVTPMYGASERTMELLVLEGIEWCSDMLDSTLPYEIQTGNGSIVAFPWSDFVDNRVLRANPRDFYDVYKETFEYLEKYESTGLLHIALHAHFGGRPMICAQLQKIVTYLREQEGAWLTTHREIVNLVKARKQDLSYRERVF